MIPKGCLSDGLTLRKEWSKATCREGGLGEVLEAKEELQSLKNRDGGEYERKSFRIVMPILSRKGQVIVEEMLSFFIFFATLGSPKLRAGDRVWSSECQRLESRQEIQSGRENVWSWHYWNGI